MTYYSDVRDGDIIYSLSSRDSARNRLHGPVGYDLFSIVQPFLTERNHCKPIA